MTESRKFNRNHFHLTDFQKKLVLMKQMQKSNQDSDAVHFPKDHLTLAEDPHQVQMSWVALALTYCIITGVVLVFTWQQNRPHPDTTPAGCHHCQDSHASCLVPYLDLLDLLLLERSSYDFLLPFPAASGASLPPVELGETVGSLLSQLLQPACFAIWIAS